MKRVFTGFILIGFIAIGSIGGCDGGGTGDGTEPTPIPTLEPTPEPTPRPPGGSCDFMPEDTGMIYTESHCATLASDFDCADFSWDEISVGSETGFCEVTGCVDCLCSAGSMTIPDDSDTGIGCVITGGLNSCYDLFFKPEIDTCFLFGCIEDFPCGPFDAPIP